MAYLQVKVTNTLGTFQGRITLAANSTKESAVEIMKEMVGNINSMNMLAIETDDENEAVVFGETILKESVVTVKAVG